MAKGPDGMTQAHALDGGNLACVAADGGVCCIVDLTSGRNVDDMRWNEGTERFQVTPEIKMAPPSAPHLRLPVSREERHVTCVPQAGKEGTFCRNLC